MIIERPLRVMGITRNLLNQFAVRFKNLRVAAGQVQAGSMIAECFVAIPRSGGKSDFISLYKTRMAILDTSPRVISSSPGN